MSSAKAKISLVLLLIIFGGIIFSLWYFKYRADDGAQDRAAPASSVSDGAPSSLSVQGSSGPFDLGQIPLGERSGDGLTDGGSSGSDGPDTATFKKYEQYKSHTSALYGEITPGDGKRIEAGKKVAMIYRVWLTDGTMVDVSKKDKSGKFIATAFTFGARDILPGLQQGMDGMKQGGSRLIIVPPAVGYGDKNHKNIPANSVLVFEVALVKVY